MTSDVTNSGAQIQLERQRLKRELTLLPLFGLIYFTVCGGSFGIEPLVGWSGPGLALLLVVITPLVFSLPNLLMVRELQSMMPVEGGYYHWVKQGFGSFAGYHGGLDELGRLLGGCFHLSNPGRLLLGLLYPGAA